MALAHVHFFSQALSSNSSMEVVIPERMHALNPARKAGEKPPVLYLLHGATDDQTGWQRNTCVERYADELGVAVVMPAGQLSFYTNMASGGAFFDFIGEELPWITAEFFNFSDKREDTFIAGCSMGGYGAMKIGLTRPKQFSAIGCFSMGSFMHVPKGQLYLDAQTTRWLELAFGTGDPCELIGTEHDILALADKAVREGKPLPRIFHVCGTEDDPQILGTVRLTHELFRDKPYEYSYSEGPGGHDWTFWDEWIRKYLKWLVE